MLPVHQHDDLRMMDQQTLRKLGFEGLRKKLVHRPLHWLVHKGDPALHIRLEDDGPVYCYMVIPEHDIIRPAIQAVFTFQYYSTLSIS